jgi:sugar/nucleoside kinase (ribokinase family)
VTRVACVGVYIADVLGRPIDVLPTVQVSRLISEIRLTAAGSAGGTAVDLARLGADVLAVGAVGDDRLGTFLRATLEDEGIDTEHVVVKPGVTTSATMLPISSAGVRPAWHVVGANAQLGPADVPGAVLAGCDAVHFGGVTALPGLDGEPAARLLERARAAGAFVTADCLGVKRDDTLALLEHLLPHVDVFMPNDAEALKITGASRIEDAAAAFLRLGAGAAIVTAGADGCVIADADGVRRQPALRVPVVDTTGAGDAFCAGVITGHGLGWPLDAAARLGTAAAALTLQGLGSDAGIRSLADTLAFMEREELAAGA